MSDDIPEDPALPLALVFDFVAIGRAIGNLGSSLTQPENEVCKVCRGQRFYLLEIFGPVLICAACAPEKSP